MKNLIVSAFLISLLAPIFLAPPKAYSAFGQWSPLTCEIDNTVFTVGGGSVATIQGFVCIFKYALNIIFPFAGLASFFMIIAGGFQHLTSGGSKENVQKAWGTITWGVVGLFFIVLSWFALKFLSILTNTELTNFVIPGP